MARPIRPEDFLPDDQSVAEVNGSPIRKGTAAAFFSNLRTLQSLPAESPDRVALLQALRSAVPALRDLGLFDLFEFRSPQLADLLGV